MQMSLSAAVQIMHIMRAVQRVFRIQNTRTNVSLIIMSAQKISNLASIASGDDREKIPV